MRDMSVRYIFFTLLALLPFISLGQELVLDTVTIEKAVVREILSERTNLIPGTSVSSVVQELRAEILSGKKEGQVVVFENDYLPLKEGQRFFLRHETGPYHTSDLYAVLEPDRSMALWIFIIMFLVLLVSIGGMQGMRGLLTLIASIGLIVYVLFPNLIAGHSPILVSILVASLIVIVGAYVTHGWNITTSAAVIGMIITLCVTGILAHTALTIGHFTGIDSEEAVYLNFDTEGTLDFKGLMFGGIIIGLLGVLYDAAISQAIAVEELLRAGMRSKKSLFKRAMRMGREHIGALVNTLAIAYVGVSLPLLLLFYHSSNDIVVSLNRELFAGEILRTMIGGSGVLLTIPLTTTVAILLLTKKKEFS